MRSPGFAASIGFVLIFAFVVAFSFVEFRPPLPEQSLAQVLKR